MDGERPPAEPGTGSSDEQDPAKVMRAIDEAMKQYYGCENWLYARSKDKPGLP